ncbi:TPA: hypothetical protein ACPJZX_000649 [Vibrio diabolicus]
MSIENLYLRELLIAIEENDKNLTTVKDLEALGIKVYLNNNEYECRLDAKFHLHFQLLVEEGLIVDCDLTPYKTMGEAGVMFDSYGDAWDIELCRKMFWLTAKGRERLSTLTKSEVGKYFEDDLKKLSAKALTTIVTESIKTGLKSLF